MSKLKYTPQGFSYIDIGLDDCLRWGGMGICNSCGKGPFKKLKLVYVLTDTYCKNMSKQDVEHDLKIQDENHIRWYRYHLNR